MNKVKIIPIFNQVDVHAARMYTREAARQIGMELIDQARVSLATSSLAECLKMIPAQEDKAADPALGSSQITIRLIENGSLDGIQIEFSCSITGQNDCVQQQLEKIRTLVDEIHVNQSTEGVVQIILMKLARGALMGESAVSQDISNQA